MLLAAARDFHIDLQNSWMVGDSETDVEAGKNAGCRTVFVQRDGASAESCDADRTVKSLLEFVDRYL
jgi:D-glycero-D-manno-heptose 1,7-bisphosphate phosphatase